MNNIIIILSALLFFIMFIYSGIEKILNFDKKVQTLQEKLTNFPTLLLNIGMVLVIILEIFGPIIILTKLCLNKNSPHILNILANITLALLVLFLITVTLIYHPPSSNKMIPFLSNCTTLAGVLFLFIILNT
jgi:uncharacterized membrane protein YphA (DoxX/SURF4 family)